MRFSYDTDVVGAAAGGGFITIVLGTLGRSLEIGS